MVSIHRDRPNTRLPREASRGAGRAPLWSNGNADCPPGHHEVGTVLAGVKDASRRLRRWPAAPLTPAPHSAHRSLRSGRRNRRLNRTEKLQWNDELALDREGPIQGRKKLAPGPLIRGAAPSATARTVIALLRIVRAICRAA